MSNDVAKRAAAIAALKLITEDMVIGVGTGSTVNIFIEELQSARHKIEGAVATSVETAKRLKALSIPILDLNSVNDLHFYFDGADEINPARQMIKGAGGASTREKIIAMVAKQFVCMVDPSKVVDMLGAFPIALEVLPMARSYVARQIVKMGGDPVYREGFVTDNGNVILDVYNLKLLDAVAVENELKGIVGVVENGLFAKRKADIVFVGERRL